MSPYELTNLPVPRLQRPQRNPRGGHCPPSTRPAHQRERAGDACSSTPGSLLLSRGGWTSVAVGREEGRECLRCVMRTLFREEVATVDRVAGDLCRQLAPELEWTALVDVPGPDRSGPAPQREHRAGDPVPRRAIGMVVLAVDARGGAVLLADRVQVVRVLKLSEVLRTLVIVEGVRRRAPWFMTATMSRASRLGMAR